MLTQRHERFQIFENISLSSDLVELGEAERLAVDLTTLDVDE